LDVDIGALRQLAQDRGLAIEPLLNSIEEGLGVAYRATPGADPTARVSLDRESGRVLVTLSVTDEDGETKQTDLTPSGFGRVAAAFASQHLVKALREAEGEKVYGEFSAKEGDIVSGVVQQGRDKRGILINLGQIEGVLPPEEQVKTESYPHGRRLKCYVVDVKRSPTGPVVVLSRTHPGLVRGLFALEAPEVADGSVLITNTARDAGDRTKMAVKAMRDDINPKGACIGPSGQRVRSVIEELGGEKIDIVDFSDDLAEFAGNALAPARAVSAEVVDLESKAVRVVVPDYQLSLAIGRQGQNARLAARLSGAKIDIVSDAQSNAEVKEAPH
jgi:N utilization substance protein A